ncbi:MAG TPA: surface-adhesin E family protein [Dissulfurispiraceae bacterium]|nr:surface-adhesin E family protein [Dissulfurispiraceae bacterium]
MKRFVILLIAGVLVLSFITIEEMSATDGRWKLIDSSKMGKQFYDTESIMYTSPSMVKVWIRVEVTEGFWEMMGVRSDRALWEIDCQNRLYRTLQRDSVKKDGTSAVTKEPSVWEDIPPESNPEFLMDTLCKQSPKKKAR